MRETPQERAGGFTPTPPRKGSVTFAREPTHRKSLNFPVHIPPRKPPLSEAQLRSCERVFHSAGGVRAENLAKVLAELHLKPSSSTAIANFCKDHRRFGSDDGGDGPYLNYQEFCDFVAQQVAVKRGAQRDADALEAFAAMGGGTDGEGAMDPACAAALRDACEFFALGVDFARVQPADGQLSFGRFKALLGDDSGVQAEETQGDADRGSSATDDDLRYPRVTSTVASAGHTGFPDDGFSNHRDSHGGMEDEAAYDLLFSELMQRLARLPAVEPCGPSPPRQQQYRASPEPPAAQRQSAARRARIDAPTPSRIRPARRLAPSPLPDEEAIGGLPPIQQWRARRMLRRPKRPARLPPLEPRPGAAPPARLRPGDVAFLGAAAKGGQGREYGEGTRVVVEGDGESAATVRVLLADPPPEEHDPADATQSFEIPAAALQRTAADAAEGGGTTALCRLILHSPDLWKHHGDSLQFAQQLQRGASPSPRRLPALPRPLQAAPPSTTPKCRAPSSVASRQAPAAAPAPAQPPTPATTKKVPYVTYKAALQRNSELRERIAELRRRLAQLPEQPPRAAPPPNRPVRPRPKHRAKAKPQEAGAVEATG